MITVGVIGYGYWGPNLVRNFLECKDAEVKYVCDKSDEKLGKVKNRYPSLNITKDCSELYSDPSLDAIIIATPISTHFSLAKEAIKKGKHVLIEKPLAATTEQGRELISLAEEKNVVLMTGHTFEYSPPVIKIKEILEIGEIGNIYFISSSRVNLGIHQKDANVIWDLAPHDFSILLYWLDKEPESISALGRGCIDGNKSDVAFINLCFPGETIAEVQLSWLSPIKLRRTIIVGSKKMLLYDDTEAVEKVKIYDHGVKFDDPSSFGEFHLSYRTGDIVSPRLDNYEPLFAEVCHFIECIQLGEKPKTDGAKGLRVVRALEAADKSLRNNGAMVKL